MIYESRIYKAVPGRLPDINARFANHTVGFFKQYDIGMMGFWTGRDRRQQSAHLHPELR